MNKKNKHIAKINATPKNNQKNKHIPIDIVIVSIIMLAANLLPVVDYTFRQVNYALYGTDFIIGKLIAGGKITVQTSIPLCTAVGATVAIILAALLYPKVKARLGAVILCILSIIAIVGNVLVVSRIRNILAGINNIKVSFGNIIIVLLGMVVLIRALYLLWKEKAVSALDFMIIPGMLYFIINNYLPMIGIFIAFKKINYTLGFIKSPWCGFDNFKILFANTGSIFSSDAFIITRNTLLYNITFIILGTTMGIIVGICLADIFSKTLQRFFQTTILLPQLISMIIVAYIVYAFLSNETGLVNSMRGEESKINFYTAKQFWPFILVFVHIWKQLGYSAIIFLAAIVGIDKNLYEAANVDGANKLMQIKYITLPLLKPTVITLIMLQVGRIFYSDFGLFYQVPMNSGTLYSVTNTVDTYVYRSLMVLNNISTASAVSTFQAIVGFVIVFIVNMAVCKFDKENALF